MASVFVSVTTMAQAGPVVQYSFDGNAADSSGYNNDGIVSGVTYVSGMNDGQAAYFDGSSYIDIQSNSGLRSGNYSISFSIKTTQTTPNVTLVGALYESYPSPDQNVSGYDVNLNYGVTPDGSVLAHHMTAPTGNWGSLTTSPVNDGNWHQVTTTFDGTISSMYVDGILENTHDATTTHYYPGDVRWFAPSPDLTIRLGSENPLRNSVGTDGYANFVGTMDEFQIFDYALSAGEVDSIYQGVGGIPDGSVSMETGSGGFYVASDFSSMTTLLDENGQPTTTDLSTAADLIAATQTIQNLQSIDLEALQTLLSDQSDNATLGVALISIATAFEDAALTAFKHSLWGGSGTDLSAFLTTFDELVTIGTFATDALLLALAKDSTDDVISKIDELIQFREEINNLAPGESITISRMKDMAELLDQSMVGARASSAMLAAAVGGDPDASFFENLKREFGAVAVKALPGGADAFDALASTFGFILAANDTLSAAEQFGEAVQNASVGVRYNLFSDSHKTTFEKIAKSNGYTEPRGMTLEQIFNGDADGSQISTFNPSGEGTAEIISPLDGNGNKMILLTTGSPISISQTIPTADSPLFLEFDFIFDSDEGFLDIFLSDYLLDTLFSSDFIAGELNSWSYWVVDPFLLQKDFLNWRVTFDGPTGSQLYLDNFQVSSLQAVPEPSTFGLLGIGFMSLGLITIGRRRRDGVPLKKQARYS